MPATSPSKSGQFARTLLLAFLAGCSLAWVIAPVHASPMELAWMRSEEIAPVAAAGTPAATGRATTNTKSGFDEVLVYAVILASVIVGVTVGTGSGGRRRDAGGE